MNVLITGGAGFIGRHLARRLLKEDCRVTLFDNLSPQIHGHFPKVLLDPDIAHTQFIVGDVRDCAALSNALVNQDVVVHFAAETGTGQSMYEVSRYQQVNIGGTANLLDILVNNKSLRVQKLILASSRAIYGEGKYECPVHGIVYPQARKAVDLRAGLFEPRCPQCGTACLSTATDEDTPPNPSSFYGLTKLTQEQSVLLFARALGLSAYALRFQNVFGPGQSLNNPYTGILAVFSNLARTNQTINIFEDGEESRDFVYIDDVIEATWLAIRSTNSLGPSAINVGSGQRTSVKKVAQEIVKFFNSKSALTITGDFREGDIRHNLASLEHANALLGFKPTWQFTEGLNEFLTWANSETVGSVDDYQKSLLEMRSKGLMK